MTFVNIPAPSLQICFHSTFHLYYTHYVEVAFDFQNKTASYFTSMVGLFRNGRGMAVQSMQALANHRQVWISKKRNLTL